ncbi:polyprenyl synthetase family protein [Saltatorellus ferox]|uniref:polyprenyl synthetase family protein n=1 Tax=Saltatorellus ferox TaxID=2528018 RepID=UPI003AF3460D
MTDSVEAARAWLEETRLWSEAALERFVREAELGPPEIADATRYALLGGGKRIRPALVRLAGEAAAGGQDAMDPATKRAVEAAAIAIECVHTYSLVHDDLPCMDDDDLRRGRPTVHKVYGEAAAVLAGDALLTLAFETLAAGMPAPAAARATLALARAAGPAGMVGGQALDLAGEGQDLAADRIRVIHELKTARLIAAAAELGAIAAGGTEAQARLAAGYGRAIGLTFQAVDDVLDVTGDAATLGKTPGKDQDARKGTLVAALGLEGARAEAERHAHGARNLAAKAGFGVLGLGLVELLAARRA